MINRGFSRNELGALVLEQEDSLVYSNNARIFYHTKRWSVFTKKNQDSYGFWTDSTLQKREYYSEEIRDAKSKKKVTTIYVEFVPGATPHDWLLDNIESIYKPLLEKVDREYFQDGNKIDYKCLLNEEKDICYERYEKDGITTFNVGSLEEGDNFRCNGAKTFARISISIRSKNKELDQAAKKEDYQFFDVDELRAMKRKKKDEIIKSSKKIESLIKKINKKLGSR